MLPRQNRLVEEYDFRRVRQKGRQFGSPFFSLFALKTLTDHPSRFGFVVSTKVDKRATRRNRIKRVFRSEVANLLPQVRPGFFAAFWVRSSALAAQPDKVRAAIREALQKTGIVE